MHRRPRTHLWWFLFTFTFTLLQFSAVLSVLPFPHYLHLLDFSIHLFICLGILLSRLALIYSSELRAKHVHESWIASALHQNKYTSIFQNTDSTNPTCIPFFLCLGNNFIKSYPLWSLSNTIQGIRYWASWAVSSKHLSIHTSCLCFHDFND